MITRFARPACKSWAGVFMWDCEMLLMGRMRCGICRSAEIRDILNP
jgi:hypothetical protein